MSTQPNRLIGGEYLVKNATYNDIFTYEDFSEEQRMIIESAKEFIDKEVVPKKHRYILQEVRTKTKRCSRFLYG